MKIILKSILVSLLIMLSSISYAGGDIIRPNPNNLPPDPGKAGKMTLNGIDSNNNGVRDDIEIAIYKRHPNDKGKRDASMQYAGAIQKLLIFDDATGDEVAGFTVVINTMNAAVCIFDRNGGLIEGQKDKATKIAYDEIFFIVNLLINTAERKRKFENYSAIISLSPFGKKEHSDPCDQ